MNKTYKKYFSLLTLFFLMALTRNSHSLTAFSLPDATMALFFIGGFHLKDLRWFAGLFLLSTLIDAITSYTDPSMNLWLNISYFGMIFAYGAMWLGGYITIKVKSLIYLFIISVVSTLIGFIISTQTFNLLSGRFPDMNIKQSIQTGWEYLPQSLLYTIVYLIVFLGIQSLFKRKFVSRKANAI